MDRKDMFKNKQEYNYVSVFIYKFNKLFVTLFKKTDIIKVIAIRYYKTLYKFLGIFNT